METNRRLESPSHLVEGTHRIMGRLPTVDSAGCGAAWLACLTGGQEVAGSNPASPTIEHPGVGGWSSPRFRLHQSKMSALFQREADELNKWDLALEKVQASSF